MGVRGACAPTDSRNGIAHKNHAKTPAKLES
jgi:hypothetical protein